MTRVRTTLLVLSSLSMLIAPRAFAELETDQAAGKCAVLLKALGKPTAAMQALRSADNINRAINFGQEWGRQFNRNADNKTMVEVLVASAVSDCRKIGIRASSE